MSTNHDLAQAATDKLWKQDRQTFESVSTIIADTYAEPMAELERLKRQVAFAKLESLLAIPSPWGSPSEIRCLLCKNTWWHECRPHHHPDCPHNNEVAT